MSKLLVKPAAPDQNGRIHCVTPASAGWDHVGFEVYRLADGQSLQQETGGREICLVLLSGKAVASAAGEDFGVIGGRNSPFEPDPWSLYVPGGASWTADGAGAVRAGDLLGAGASWPAGACDRARSGRLPDTRARAPIPAMSATSCRRLRPPRACSSSRSSRLRAAGRAIRRTSMTGTRLPAESLAGGNLLPPALAAAGLCAAARLYR